MRLKADTGFSEKLRAGWTQKQVMAYYALAEEQYEMVMKYLKVIGSVGSEGAV